jgi:hypothetical protein
MTEITVAAIIAEFGAYYENAGQNQKRIIQDLLFGFETLQYMTNIPTDDSIFKMSKSAMGRVLQGYKTDWSPTNGVTFTPNPIELFKNKIDKQFHPDDIENTWLGFLSSNNTDRKEWPFVKWLIEVHIIPQAHEDLETAIFDAEYVAPSAGSTPGALLEIMNGIKYQLLAGVGNGLNSIVLNVLTKANIFDEVESFRDQISLIYQRKTMNYFMSPTWASRYKTAYRNEFPTKTNLEYSSVEFSPHSIVGLPSMYNTDIIFATPKENFLYITKKAANMTKFEIESVDRLVKLFSDFEQGIGFGTLGGVFASIPSESSGSGS